MNADKLGGVVIPAVLGLIFVGVVLYLSRELWLPHWRRLWRGTRNF